MTQIINLHHLSAAERRRVMDGDDPNVVYVGRPTEWGNPFQIGRDGTRADVIAKYREYLGTSDSALVRWLKANVHRLRGKTLACWCVPAACHAEVLVEMAEAQHGAEGARGEEG